VIRDEALSRMPTDSEIIEGLIGALRPKGPEAKWRSELVAEALREPEWIGAAILAALEVDDCLVAAPIVRPEASRHCPACGRLQGWTQCEVCGAVTLPGAAHKLMPLSEVSPYWRGVIAAVRAQQGWAENGTTKDIPF